MPYLYPLAWRVCIGSSNFFHFSNGAFVRLDDDSVLVVTYSSSSENSYFGWDDATNDNARALAEKFLSRVPEVCVLGRGRDWAYAGWLSELVGMLEAGPFLPVLFDDHSYPPTNLRSLPIWNFQRLEPAFQFPLPPPGELGSNGPVAKMP